MDFPHLRQNAAKKKLASKFIRSRSHFLQRATFFVQPWLLVSFKKTYIATFFSSSFFVLALGQTLRPLRMFLGKNYTFTYFMPIYSS